MCINLCQFSKQPIIDRVRSDIENTSSHALRASRVYSFDMRCARSLPLLGPLSWSTGSLSSPTSGLRLVGSPSIVLFGVLSACSMLSFIMPLSDRPSFIVSPYGLPDEGGGFRALVGDCEDEDDDDVVDLLSSSVGDGA